MPLGNHQQNDESTNENLLPKMQVKAKQLITQMTTLSSGILGKIAPDWIDPISQRVIRDLLLEIDTNDVHLL